MPKIFSLSLMVLLTVSANAATIKLSPIPDGVGLDNLTDERSADASTERAASSDMPLRSTDRNRSFVSKLPMTDLNLESGSMSRVWLLDTSLPLSRNVRNWAKEQERLSGKKVNVIWNLQKLIRFEVGPIIEGDFKGALSQLSTAMKNTKIPATISFNSLTNTVTFNPIIR